VIEDLAEIKKVLLRSERSVSSAFCHLETNSEVFIG